MNQNKEKVISLALLDFNPLVQYFAARFVESSERDTAKPDSGKKV